MKDGALERAVNALILVMLGTYTLSCIAVLGAAAWVYGAVPLWKALFG